MTFELLKYVALNGQWLDLNFVNVNDINKRFFTRKKECAR